MDTNTSPPRALDLTNLTDKELLELAESLKVLDDRRTYNKQDFLYPLMLANPRYRKHLMFFEAGAIHRERALIAGNRTGKTYTALTEVSFHLNGKYPDEWKGKKFDRPIRAWEVGKTHDTTKEILQKYLLGPRYAIGTGFIPKDDIVKVTIKPGLPEAIQDVYVRHYSNGEYDGISHLSFKSYVQGVEAFMGEQVDVVHLDEEPDHVSIYSECLTRTMTTQGVILCTFTPLLGLSDVVLSFLPGGKFPNGGMGVLDHED